MINLKTFKKIATATVATSLALMMMVGCGSKTETPDTTDSSGDNSKTEDSSSGSATTFEMWTFVELHGTYYQEMAKLWNEKNPDKQINLKITVLPYDDMHNKLQSALISGKGAPDLCDIEVGKFPNFLKGTPQLYSLNDAIAPYKDNVVQSRLDLYSKDGTVYGAPTHVGATVAFYNTELLDAAGIDYSTIKTWNDFKAAGIKYYEATGKYLGTADTSAMWTLNALLTEQGADITDEDGKPVVNSDTVVKSLTMLKDLQDNNVIATVPGGQPDTEEAYGAFNNGDYAVAFMPLWQMSRYVNYMPELAGKITLAPLPVFEEGQPRSVGGGGTGTVVTNTAKDTELAADFVAYAKLSEDANIKVWEVLGFDPVNTSIWTNEEITHNADNQYVKYFVNNPFDVLNEIKDEIELIKSVEASPTINNVFCTTVLNSIFEDNADIKTTLDDAQAQIENELQ